MAVEVTSEAEGLDRRAFSVANLRRMVEGGIVGPDEMVELFGGDLIPRLEPTTRHEAIKNGIARAWSQASIPDLVVCDPPLMLDEFHLLIPDLAVCRSTERSGGIAPSDVLLAVEVSDDTLDYDLRRKPALYASSGVGELWVIDVLRGLAHLHRHPGERGYAEVRELSAIDRLVPHVAPAGFALSLVGLRTR